MTSENEDVQSQDGKSPSRREREREQHRLEVLDAAERVFARDGYHGTTVESIAKEAEFAVGTLYNFFSGKDDLFAAVLFRIADELMEEMERDVLTRKDPAEALGAVFDLRVKIDAKHGDFFRLLVEAGPRGSDETHARMRRFFEKYVEVLRGIIERGVREGVFSKVDPYFVAFMIHGVSTAMTLYWTIRRPGASMAELVERTKAGFLAQLRVGTPGTKG